MYSCYLCTSDSVPPLYFFFFFNLILYPTHVPKTQKQSPGGITVYKCVVGPRPAGVVWVGCDGCGYHGGLGKCGIHCGLVPSAPGLLHQYCKPS